jgi:glycosyltransferase involved in cell wall biosynthesis
VNAPELHVAVPGALEQRTGGYIYDARIVGGLRRLGWCVTVHNLEGRFPSADARAHTSIERTLAALPRAARIALDGLAMGALPEPLRAHADRLRLLSLVHHPLADETGLPPVERERLGRLEREALAACAGVIVTSRYTAGRLGAYGVSEGRIRIVVPGTDAARLALGPGEGAAPRLLCVASVIPRKGHEVLVRALHAVRDLRWRCVCAGSLTLAPDHARRVRQQVRDAGLEARVAFPGECGTDALDGYYATSSLFVLPSYYEGYGMALAEALARGLPVVSTTGGAIPSTLPADASVLVAPGDSDALARALRHLLSEAPDRARLSASARRHAASLPSWDRAAELFAAAVLELTPDG